MLENKKSNPKHPCISCVYFKSCGNTARTEFCAGRKTKKQQKEEAKNERA